MSSGRRNTCEVEGWYWMSCSSAFWNTTLPGVVATFLPSWKALFVGHADAQLPFALLDVGEQVVQPLDQVVAARGHGLAQHLRVGGGEIGWRQRVHVLAREEGDLLLRVLGQALDAGHRVLDVPRRDQVGLLDVVEHEVARPVVVLEPAVALGRLGDRDMVLPEHLHPGRLPQAHGIDPVVDRCGGEGARVHEHARVQVHVGLGDPQLVLHHRGDALLEVLLPELLQDARGALGDLVQHACRFLAVHAVSALFHASSLAGAKRATPSAPTVRRRRPARSR